MIRIKKHFFNIRDLTLLVIVAAAVTGCGGGGGTDNGDNGTGTLVQVVDCSSVVSNQTVTIVSTASGFDPATVTLAVNGVVKWTNADAVTHTVTSTTVPQGGAFNRTVASSASVCLKITSAGSYSYKCSLHPSMTGSVTVQ